MILKATEFNLDIPSGVNAIPFYFLFIHERVLFVVC